METKALRKLLRARYPLAIIRIEPMEFSYVHQTAEIFERRALPALAFELESKEVIGTDRNGRKLFARIEAQEAIEYLRACGLCAEFTAESGFGFGCVVLADRSNWPINISFSLGQWHTKGGN